MKHTARIAAVAAVAGLCVSGCVTKPIVASTDALPAFQGQPLTIVTYDPHAAFSQITAGEAAFGAIGGIAAAANSNDLVKKYDLVNPSLRVAEKFTVALKQKFNPATVNTITSKSDRESVSNLATLAGKKGLVFDTQGSALSVYFPFDWAHYKVDYFGTGRLVDASTGKVVAQAPCKIDPSDKKGPTYDELYADNAALLKSKFQSAADECVEQMTQAMFKN